MLGLTGKAAVTLTDPHRKASCRHVLETMVRQRVYALALGYEWCRDGTLAWRQKRPHRRSDVALIWRWRLAVPVPIVLADDLVHAVVVRPGCGDLHNARGAAVDEHQVPVFHPRLLQLAENGVGVAYVLAAGDGDQRAFWQMRLVLAVLPVAQVVHRIDRHRSWLSGLGRVAAVPQAPDLSGDVLVRFRRRIAHLLECVEPLAEILGAVGWAGTDGNRQALGAHGCLA